MCREGSGLLRKSNFPLLLGEQGLHEGTAEAHQRTFLSLSGLIPRGSECRTIIEEDNFCPGDGKEEPQGSETTRKIAESGGV